jgi:signal transduction histidine kinase
MSTVEASYCEYVGQALQTQQRELSRRWLERLVALLPVDANAVFTSNELLDHIPRLIDQIGKYVSAPDMADIAANTLVTEHARELGQLRHRQQASVYQVLREYDLLAELLEQFLDERTDAMATAPAAKECLEASRRVGRAVRVLMQTTVATFISEYTDTITAQATRIDQFNRAVSHELRNVLGTLQFSGALLKNGSPPDPTTQERILATLSRNTDRALQIVRSLERLPRSGILAGDTPTEQRSHSSAGGDGRGTRGCVADREQFPSNLRRYRSPRARPRQPGRQRDQVQRSTEVGPLRTAGC